jgi:electron transfer flavoprotein beta subunit
MRIVVCVKQVYDPATVRISRSREEFDLRGATRITNPADRYALEAGLRLREAVGDAQADDTAHEAVAMGADRAMLISGASWPPPQAGRSPARSRPPSSVWPPSTWC